MEPDMRWSIINRGRRRRCSGVKRVQDGVDFRLGAIEQLTERKRERRTNRKVPNPLIKYQTEKYINSVRH